MSLARAGKWVAIPIVLLILNGLLLWRALSPKTAAPRARLVILLAIDTLRADHLGCYGYKRNTSPCIDAMAREGIVFENAFSQFNYTLMSFSSMLTGAYNPRLENFKLSTAYPTVASMLQSCGVRTLATVGGGHLSPAFGLDRGFDEYLSPENFASLHYSLPSALHWLDEYAASPRPTFMFVHGYDPHAPYHKPLIFDQLFAPPGDETRDEIVRSGNAPTRIWRGEFFPTRLDPTIPHRNRAQELYERHAPSIHLSATTVERIAATYDSAIRYSDIHVGILLNRIRALGLADQTTVILVGDHGEELLEKGLMGHMIALDDSELHVPLIVWSPSTQAPGQRVRDVVEMIDVMPTLLGEFRLDAPSGTAARRLTGPRDPARVAYSASGRSRGGLSRSVRSLDYRLVTAEASHAGGFDAEALYAASDTAALRNLIGRPELRDVVATLRQSLNAEFRDSR